MIPRPMGEQLRASEPREMLHFDFLQMAFSEEEEAEYLLVLKDGFCTFVLLFPCKAAPAAATVEGLLLWFSIFGVADVWVSDQGTHFRNQIMTAMQRELRVLHHFVTAGCAWANGSVERANREALRVFRTLLAESSLPYQRWRELVPVVQATINATVSETRLNGRSPYEVMFGKPPSHPLDAVLGVDFGLDEGESDGDGPSQMVEAHCAALTEALAAMVPDVAAGQARRHERNLAATAGRRAPDFEIGDYVLVLAKIRRHKLQMKWLGPRRVVDTLNEHVYVLEDMITMERSVAHASRLKKYADNHLQMTVDLREQILYDEQGLCVEAITGWRNTESGIQLRVRWLGFEAADATWEPLATLYADVPDLIGEFAEGRQSARDEILQDALAELRLESAS